MSSLNLNHDVVRLKMEERYGIPSISLSFYGKRDTSQGLLAIAEALNDEDLVKRTRALVARASSETRFWPKRATASSTSSTFLPDGL